MRQTSVVMRRLLLAAGLVVAGLTGCSSTGFGQNALLPPGFQRGTRGTMDGFVFVPSRARGASGVRQAATGTAIPHAVITVYRIVGGGAPNELLLTTQADAEGFYRAAGMPLNVLLLVVATDPFSLPGQAAHTVSGVISFDVAEDRTRNLNPASTIAARVIENQGTGQPVSSQQVTALETEAEGLLTDPYGPDVTTDEEALAAAAGELEPTSSGSLYIHVYSNPAVAATVKVNGATVGTVTTLLPNSEPGANLVELEPVAVGQVNVQLSAAGFMTDNFVVDILAGQENTAQRVLVPLPAGANKPPTIVDQRTLPSRLGFSGGEIAIQAIVVDSEGDATTVSAQVVPSIPSSAARTSEGWTVPLTLGENHLYSGTLTVPGNPNTANATYVVTISAQDAGHTATPTQSILTFQVAGTNPPPDPPTSG